MFDEVDPRDRGDDRHELEVHWLQLGRGAASGREDDDPTDRDHDTRKREGRNPSHRAA